MRELDAINVFQLDRLIEQWIKELQRPQGAVLTDQELRYFHGLINSIMGDRFSKFAWTGAESSLCGLNIILEKQGGIKTVSAESVQIALRELQRAIYKELRSRKFVMIDPQKIDFLGQKNLFGNQVAKAFPSTKEEIRLAGNCLAMDFNTAAMFHLLRVAELGMRALARHLKVKAKKNTIDSAGWTEIIKHIEDATAKRWQKLPKAVPARRKAVAFLKLCEVSADELNVLKEIWRNNVMHAGLAYNEHEAHGVYVRVRDFMQRLAVQVSETEN
jgi:hypothetical protein